MAADFVRVSFFQYSCYTKIGFLQSSTNSKMGTAKTQNRTQLMEPHSEVNLLLIILVELS